MSDARGALVVLDGALNCGLAAIPVAFGASGEVDGRLVTDVALMGVVVLLSEGCSVRCVCRGVDSMVGNRGIVVLVGDGVGFTIGSLGCFVP